MPEKNVIEVENLSKTYVLGETKVSSSRVSNKTTPAIQNDQRVHGNIFWALRNINFTVTQGEVLGIVGKNGAGKSTLLKILSHITAPTSGKIKIKGSLASLLEVGTGFHPELTGRENIYLNGAILGLTKPEIKTHLDSILDFSGIQHHIDTPVKRYSSGMKVRLGFAVAAHLNPDILIVDEVLAVGDAEFQAKCLGKMGEITKAGRTVLFVSHNMAAVQSLCSSAILLNNGEITATGDTRSIIEKYLLPSVGTEGTGKVEWSIDNNPGSNEVTMLSVSVLNEQNEVRESFYTSVPVIVEIKYRVNEKIPASRLIIQLKDSMGVVAFTSTNQIQEQKEGKSPGIYTSTCTIPGNLLNQGKYKVFVHMGIPGFKVLANNFFAIAFNTILMGNNGSLDQNWQGILAPQLKWETVKQ
jgi:lipopolysaccharide transport system ATP-binding protein